MDIGLLIEATAHAFAQREGGLMCRLALWPNGVEVMAYMPVKNFEQESAQCRNIVPWDIIDQATAGSNPIIFSIDHVIQAVRLHAQGLERRANDDGV